MDTAALLEKLQNKQMPFASVIEFIESRYVHTPTAFVNGAQKNGASENQGSAKVFGFAALEKLTAADTLLLFAEHYDAVLANPEGTDHQNIRQFMISGWDGISFEGNALQAK